jgi:hypothetical protein
MNTLSWQSETAPLPMEINPRVLFERLFGGGGTREDRLARMRTDRSLLDFVAGDLKDVRANIGARDRARLDQYLDHVREIERRIQRAEQQAQTIPTIPAAPVGVPESFEEHALLMFELLAVAYEADLSRVFTFMLGRELSQRTVSEHRRHRAAPFDLTSRQSSRRDRGAREGQHLSPDALREVHRASAIDG